MLKKTSSIVFFLLLAIALYWLYQWLQAQPDPAAMSRDSLSVEQSPGLSAWLAFATSLLSFLAAVVGLVQKILEWRMRER